MSDLLKYKKLTDIEHVLLRPGMYVGSIKHRTDDISIYDEGRFKTESITYNPAFDWQWINYYFHLAVGSNPFGYSARRIGDVYCGAMGNMRAKWKHLRKTPHDHNPVNDAKGNAEAFRVMQELMREVKQLRKNNM